MGGVILEKIVKESTGKHWSKAKSDSIKAYIAASEMHEREEFDKDRMILNCKNCFVNLREYKIINPDQLYSLFVSILLFEVYFCLFVHSYNYQHDVYKNKPRFASKIQLKRTRKNIF